MKKLNILLILLVVTMSSGCNNSTHQNETTFIPNDTTASFKIGNHWATPKKSFEFNSLGESSGNTLHLVTCGDYVYFPYGKLTDKSSLNSSMLKDFTINDFKRDTFTITNVEPPILGWTEELELNLGDNKLNLFLDNDTEASTHGYIRAGEILDNKVTFLNMIKVGMTIEDFYKKFFDYFPEELYHQYKVIEFESCVTDIAHIYSFDNGRLKTVKFISE